MPRSPTQVTSAQHDTRRFRSFAMFCLCFSHYLLKQSSVPKLEPEKVAKMNLFVFDDVLSKMAVISKEPCYVKWKNKHGYMKFLYPSQQASIHRIDYWIICGETLLDTLCQCTYRNDDTISFTGLGFLFRYLFLVTLSCFNVKPLPAKKRKTEIP